MEEALVVLTVRQASLGTFATTSPSRKSYKALTEIPLSGISVNWRASLHCMPWDVIHRLKTLNRLIVREKWRKISKYSKLEKKKRRKLIGRITWKSLLSASKDLVTAVAGRWGPTIALLYHFIFIINNVYNENHTLNLNLRGRQDFEITNEIWWGVFDVYRLWMVWFARQISYL